MDNSLLATKLFIPPVRPGLVSRSRLLEKFRYGLNSSLVLVSAPAGFGKTTLVSEWVRQNHSNFPAAWLSLEESENDPNRFWSYFIAALQTLQPKIGDIALSLLRSPQPVPIQSTLTALINDLTTFPQDFVLVLDDYHFIQAPTIHQGLAFLLEHLPPRMHVVIGTRIDPALPLTTFRGKGTLLEIGADDLRFTLEEAASLFSESGFAAISRENIQVLNTRAEGWVVGLKMALLSVKGEKDVSGFIASFNGSQRYIMDYLMEEVLEKQPQQVQDFLLKTSVLERMNGSLCDAITGAKGGRDVLLRLEKDNLFIVTLDASGEWYRYEHLFAELLRHHLEVESGKEAAKGLLIKASRWYENNGYMEVAIQYALAGQDWKDAMRLISIPAVNIPNWHSLTMYNWLRQIPEDLLRGDINLYFNFIWSLEEVGQYDSLETKLSYLENAYPRDNIIQGRIAAVRTSIANTRGSFLQAEEYAKSALSLLPAAEYASGRATVSVLLGVNYINRERFVEAEPLLTEAYEFYRRVGSAVGSAYPLLFLGIIYTARGRLHRAMEIFQEVTRIDARSLSTAMAHVYLGGVFYERNDLRAEEFHLLRARELNQLFGHPLVQYSVFLSLSRLRMLQNDEFGAVEALDKADRLLAGIGNSPFNQARSAAAHILLSRAQDDSEATSRWLDKLSEYAASLPIDLPNSVRRLFIARRGKEAALKELQASHDRFAKNGIQYGVMLTSLCLALESPSPVKGLPYLAEALSIGGSEDYIRPFVDEGPPLIPLLRKAISQEIEPEYARQLLNIIEVEETQRLSRKGSLPPSNVPSGILSEREMEVLRLMSTGLSNQQIASKLVITLATAKTHVHRILEKLYAKDRLQAINRARELKLLQG